MIKKLLYICQHYFNRSTKSRKKKKNRQDGEVEKRKKEKIEASTKTYAGS